MNHYGLIKPVDRLGHGVVPKGRLRADSCHSRYPPMTPRLLRSAARCNAAIRIARRDHRDRRDGQRVRLPMLAHMQRLIRRTLLLSVCAVQPIFLAIASITAHWELCVP